MAMGSYAAGPGAFGAGMAGPSGVGGIGMTGAMGMAGRHTPMGGAVATAGYGPADGMHGGGLFGSMGMGAGVFSDSEFELNRESRGGILSVWSRSSRSHFAGLEDALSLDGDVRTTMVGADYSRGALTLGLSVGRTPCVANVRLRHILIGYARGGRNLPCWRRVEDAADDANGRRLVGDQVVVGTVLTVTGLVHHSIPATSPTA